MSLATTDPTLDDRTLAADDAPPSAYAYHDLARGDTVGRYLVLRPLGRGGMGAVYAAHDPELDRTVALKIVHRSGTRATSLKAEAQTLARLSHPNVVAVHDVGELTDGVFIAMEYVEGKTLRRWVEAHRGDMPALGRVMRQAGQGLAAAHQAGLVHLDFKPDNVMIADDGRVQVLDFGLARPQERTRSGTEVTPSGTPAYMAPEQHRCEALDARADQFSFCVTWLECAIGARVFQGASPSAIARAIVDDAPTLPTRPAALPRGVWQALLRGITHDRRARWPDMPALLEATAPRGGSKRPTLVALMVAGALGAGGTWLFSSDERRCRDAAAVVDGAWASVDAQSVLARVGTAEGALSEEQAERVVARLQGYATALAGGYDEACRVAPDDVPRKVCLDGRLEQLRANRDLALVGDSEPLERALETLPDVHECRRADEDALYREVSDPERGQALLRQLAQGEVDLELGKLDDAREALEAVAEDAKALGWQGVEALAWIRLSAVAADAGDVEQMQARYERALDLASEAGSDFALHSALSQRLQEYAMAGDVVSVQAMAPVVVAAAAKAGRSSERVPMALGNAAQLSGDYDAAETAYRQILEESGDPSVRLKALSNLGGLELYRGNYPEAKALFEKAVPASVKEHGPLSIPALKMQANLADADQQLGLVADARRRYEEALVGYGEGAGLDSRPAQHLKLNYALCLMAAGDLDAAVAVGEPAAQRMLELHPDGHPFAIAAADFLNVVDLERGRFAEVLERGHALAEQTAGLYGAEAPLVSFLRLTVAKAALETGQPTRGLEALATADGPFARLNADHPALVTVFRLRAELQLKAGSVTAALADATEATRRASAPSVHPIDRGRALLVSAQARLANGASSSDVRDTLEAAASSFAALPRHPDARPEAVATLLAADERGLTHSR